MTPANQVHPLSIQNNVGDALRFVRANLRTLAIAAAAGAGAVGVLTLLALAVPLFAVLLNPLTTLIDAAAYTAFLALALATHWRAQDAGRVWAAMVVVGFFLAIVTFVLVFPVSIILGAMLSPYASDFQSVGADQAAAMALMMRIAEENPLPLILAGLVFALAWLLLTSRLYLAAPATLDRRRILTFETWRWTKGHMLRITGARLLVLGPAYVLFTALTLLASRVVGVDIFSPESTVAFATAAPVGYAALVFLTQAIKYLIYLSLEAGLSVALYRTLAPPVAATHFQ